MPLDKRVPGELVDPLVILTLVARHDEEHVVATVLSLAVDQQARLLGLIEFLLTQSEDVGVRGRMSHVTSNVCLDYANRDHQGIPPLLLLGASAPPALRMTGLTCIKPPAHS